MTSANRDAPGGVRPGASKAGVRDEALCERCSPRLNALWWCVPAVFVKQLGSVLGGQRHKALGTFPATLQVREYPRSQEAQL